MIYSDIYNKNLTITAEQLNIMMDLYNECYIREREHFDEILTEAAGGKDPSTKLSKLNKYGVKINKSKVSSKAKECAEIFKKKGITKESKKEVKGKLAEFYDNYNSWIDINLSYIKKDDKLFSKFSKKKVYKAIILTCYVLLIQLIYMEIANHLFPGIGILSLTIVIAPLTEEGAKALAARGGYIDEFNAVFNIIEFTGYVVRGASIVDRLYAVLFHSATSFFHKLANDKDLQEKLNIHIEEGKEESTKRLVQILMTIAHSVYNIAAIAIAINRLVDQIMKQFGLDAATARKMISLMNSAYIEDDYDAIEESSMESVFDMVALQEKYKTDIPIKDSDDYLDRVKRNNKFIGTEKRGPLLLPHENRELAFITKLDHPKFDKLKDAVIEADTIYAKAEKIDNFDPEKYKKGVNACNKVLDIIIVSFDVLGTALCLSIVGFIAGLLFKWTSLLHKTNKEQSMQISAMSSIDKLEKIAKKTKDPKLKKKCIDTINKIEKANERLKDQNVKESTTDIDAIFDLVY